MATLSYNEIIPKKVIIFNNEPYLVVSHNIFRKQKSKPQNITKLKNMKTGRALDQTFHQNETVEEADLENRNITFIFKKGTEFWFHTTGTPGDRFFIPEDIIGNKSKFIKDKAELDALVYNDEIIGITIPIKIELKVTEAMEAVKGNTSSGAQKEVTVETGAIIMAPMFINEGDIISINTDTGEYSERVTKA
jgi:elongation factor P